jgi:hypothetical protein
MDSTYYSSAPKKLLPFARPRTDCRKPDLMLLDLRLLALPGSGSVAQCTVEEIARCDLPPAKPRSISALTVGARLRMSLLQTGSVARGMLPFVAYQDTCGLPQTWKSSFAARISWQRQVHCSNTSTFFVGLT